MIRQACITLLLMLIVSTSAVAVGGGGIEIVTNAGSDAVPSLAEKISGDAWLDIPTASIAGVGGFGYGVTNDNFKIGGFGFAFWSNEISKPVPAFGVEWKGLAGGFGGVILGSQFALRPIVFALNTRLGVGGISVDLRTYPPQDNATINSFGTLGFYGNVDAEIGLALGGNMLISGYAGVSGILSLTFTSPSVLPLLVPMYGIRITWGDFW